MKPIQPKGYGQLTNLIKMEKVFMIRHMEGTGTTEDPQAEIRTFFDQEGNFITRDDPRKKG